MNFNNLILYHGTRQHFDRFQAIGPGHDPNDEGVVFSHTRSLGTFFSGCPRIAAHFTLKPDVLDKGYDSHQGSSSLRENPWRFDPDPFDPNAQVLTCRIDQPNTRLYPMPVLRWLEICNEAEPETLEHMRQEYQAQGFDGILIEAAQDGDEHEDYGTPCVEYHDITVVLFDASKVSITDRKPAAEAYPPRFELNPVLVSGNTRKPGLKP